jgi:two-component system chemotaxis response regulator CheB
VVISSHSAKDQVFRALELGAIDFIAKPDPSGELPGGPSGESLKRQLERTLEMVRQLSPAGTQKRVVERPASAQVGARAPKPEPLLTAPQRVVAIASSTGGPTALMELFGALPASTRGAICVAQHMPERFTRTFAERLDKQGPFRVREADHGVELVTQSGLVCPGGRSLELERREGRFYARVLRPGQTDRYAPSADRLLTSVARAAADRAIAVVLTGMGDDAALGVQEIKRAGGMVLAESEATAVVYGMPKVAIATGCVDEVLPLPELVQRLKELVS